MNPAQAPEFAHSELWGKQKGLDNPYPLVCHLLDTASVARVLWRHWLRPGLRDLIEQDAGEGHGERTTMFAAGAHDIGKATPVFQGQLASGDPEPWLVNVRAALDSLGYENMKVPRSARQQTILKRHDDCGAMALFRGPASLNLEAADSWLSLVALSHHGSFGLDIANKSSFARFAEGRWESSRRDILSLLATSCGLGPDNWAQELPATVRPVTTVLISGLTVLADRIASQTELVREAQRDMAVGDLSLDDPAGWVNAREATFRSVVSAMLGIYQGFSDSRRSILGDHVPNPLQERAQDIGEGLWFVMSPTGSGKTEAAMLRHAQNNESLTFLLPTQATTNALMRRIQQMYIETSNVAALAHGLASIEDFYSRPLSDSPDDLADGGLFPTRFVNHGSGRLLAPVTVGTIDQALMGALPLKWTHLRLLALANSHVVIDEAHTMDHYQITLAEPLMWWFGQTRTRVTVLTATLPTWQRDALARSYAPGWSGAGVAFPSTELIATGSQAQALPMDGYVIRLTTEEAPDQVAAHVAWQRQMRVHAPNARLGIIVNVVDRAQTIARVLADAGERVIVLHSRMTAEHRRVNADALQQQLGPEGDGRALTVVGTQAIEASLDIDLDALSTDLAPAPSLIQRAGRVWRRHDAGRAVRLPDVEHLPLHVVRGTADGAWLPYAKALLSRTWRYLQDRTMIRAPDDFQEFVETREQHLDDVESDDDFDELAETSRQSSGAMTARIDLKDALDSDATISQLSQLTRFADTFRDSDEDFPKTRWIERDSRRVILCDAPSSEIPGVWTRGRGALSTIDAHDISQIRSALRGSVVVSGPILRELEGALGPVLEPQAGALRDVMAGELPPTLHYDLLSGLGRKNQDSGSSGIQGEDRCPIQEKP